MNNSAESSSQRTSRRLDESVPPEVSLENADMVSGSFMQYMVPSNMNIAPLNPMMARGNQSGTSDAQQLASLHFSNEMKGLQQFQQLSSSGNSLYLGQQHQGSLIPTSQGLTPQTQALVNSYLEQKAQAARFENQLQPRMGVMGVLSGQPMLQAPLLQDARLLMAQNQMNVAAMSNASGSQLEPPLPSPNALFSRDGSRRMRGGVIEPFPEKLHRLLHEVESAGRSDVISFIADGRAFAIHKPEKFSKEIVPHYFRQSRLSSFKRQLNLYGFELINSGPAKGGYYHKLFIKQQPELCRRMRRVAVKVQAHATTKDSGGDALGPDEPHNFDGSGLGEKSGCDSFEGCDGDAGIPKDIFEE
jgi:hypothetical protein